MFFQLLYIHLFRPFLKYKPSNTPLPAHVSPRKFLIHAAAAISKLLRLYRRTYGLRQICNIAVYIVHMACTVHVLNLPDKLAARDLVYGLGHLEEIAESWLCARRTLGILQQVSRRWDVDLPEAAKKMFEKFEGRFGLFKHQDLTSSPKSESHTTSLPEGVLSKPPSDLSQVPRAQIYAVTNGDYLPNSVVVPKTPSSVAPSPNSSLSLPPQQAREFSRLSRQHEFVVSQPQQPSQNQDDSSSSGQQQQNTSARPRRQVGSPSVLFGGVDSLMQDQEWWLRDSHQMFANWNGFEHLDLAQYPNGHENGMTNGGRGAVSDDYTNGLSHRHYGNGYANGHINFGLGDYR